MTLEREQQELWREPRQWSALKRARRVPKFLGVAMILLATVAFIPALWILVMPHDPLFRPDLTQLPAALTVAVCLAFFYFGRKISHGARARYGADLYGCINQARQAGARSALVFDIELPQIFPRILFARRHRMMAIALPYPLLIPIDDIDSVTVGDDGLMRLGMKDARKHPISAVAGDGLTRQSSAETRYVADRLREFIFMPHTALTEDERQQDALAQAFLASPSLAKEGLRGSE